MTGASSSIAPAPCSAPTTAATSDLLTENSRCRVCGPQSVEVLLGHHRPAVGDGPPVGSGGGHHRANGGGHPVSGGHRDLGHRSTGCGQRRNPARCRARSPRSARSRRRAETTTANRAPTASCPVRCRPGRASSWSRSSRSCDEPRDDRRGRRQGCRGELRLDALDPALAALGELVVVGLQVPAGDEHAELSALAA